MTIFCVFWPLSESESKYPAFSFIFGQALAKNKPKIRSIKDTRPLSQFLRAEDFFVKAGINSYCFEVSIFQEELDWFNKFYDKNHQKIKPALMAMASLLCSFIPKTQIPKPKYQNQNKLLATSIAAHSPSHLFTKSTPNLIFFFYSFIPAPNKA